MGLDLTLAIHEVVMPALDRTPEPHPLLVELVRAGHLGARTGRGFQRWAPGEAEARRARLERELLEVTRRSRPRAPAGSPHAKE